MKKERVISVGLALGVSLIFSCCARPAQQLTVSFTAMDTYMELTAYGSDAEKALTDAEAYIYKLEGLLSVTDPDSEIYAVNHSAGKPVTVSPETADVLRFALSKAAFTDGALDPTIYPVVRAWGFTTEEYRIPSEEELSQQLPLVDYARVELTGETVMVPEGMELDLGAVAKGYAADAVADMFEDAGITSGLINLGGNIFAVGNKPDGSTWRIGIQDPDGADYIGILEIYDAAVVTSGGYERYFVGEDGKPYWHILDPETGTPADSGIISATIVAESAALADALTTAVFVMGQEDAAALWKSSGTFDMVLLCEDGTVYITENLQDSFTLKKTEYRMSMITKEDPW